MLDILNNFRFLALFLIQATVLYVLGWGKFGVDRHNQWGPHYFLSFFPELFKVLLFLTTCSLAIFALAAAPSNSYNSVRSRSNWYLFLLCALLLYFLSPPPLGEAATSSFSQWQIPLRFLAIAALLLWVASTYFSLGSREKRLPPWMAALFLLLGFLFHSNVMGLSLENRIAHLLVPITTYLAMTLGSIAGVQMDIFADPNYYYPVFGTTNFKVVIAPTCAGYQGALVGAFSVLMAVRIMNPDARWITYTLGAMLCVVISFLVNGGRIFVLVLLGHFGFPEIAVGGFHVNFGALSVLSAVLSSLTVISFASGRMRHHMASLRKSRTSRFVVGSFAPQLIFLTMSLIVGIFHVTLPWLYSVQVLASSAVGIFYQKWTLPIERRIKVVEAFFVGIFAFLLWIALIDGVSTSGSGLREMLDKNSLAWTLYFIFAKIVGSCFIVPWIEELAFRQGLYRVTYGYFGAQRELVKFIIFTFASSGLFAFGHAETLAAYVVGVVYAQLYLLRRSLWSNVLAHAVTNCMIAYCVLVLDWWWLWN